MSDLRPSHLEKYNMAENAEDGEVTFEAGLSNHESEGREPELQEAALSPEATKDPENEDEVQEEALAAANGTTEVLESDQTQVQEDLAAANGTTEVLESDQTDVQEAIASNETTEDPESDEADNQEASTTNHTTEDSDSDEWVIEESDSDEWDIEDSESETDEADNQEASTPDDTTEDFRLDEVDIQDDSATNDTTEDSESDEEDVEDASYTDDDSEDSDTQDASYTDDDSEDPDGVYSLQSLDAPETLEKTIKKKPWWRRLFSKNKKPGQERPKDQKKAWRRRRKETSTCPDNLVSGAPRTAQKKKKKKPLWRLIFCCSTEQDSDSELEEVQGEQTDNGVIDEPLHDDAPKHHRVGVQGGSVQPNTISLLDSPTESRSIPSSLKPISEDELCLGFPNLAQTCYMNSTLQGLLSLTPFMQEVGNQQPVWSRHPESEIIRGFFNVSMCRFFNNGGAKTDILSAFKSTVADWNLEFEDDNQKDAHEFLSCVLGGIQSLSFDLQAAAISMGRSYICPVEAHIAFQMLSTRNCKGCGSESIRVEDFMNLSLDLVQGGSVSQCLQECLKETHLEFHCECDAKESTRRWSFLTLPNVLILQLQRFKFTKSFSAEKVNSPVVILPELMVNPESCVTGETPTRYSLVSMISHLGSTADSGHYICDAAHGQKRLRDESDRWLTFNDEEVSETTGRAVCHRRRKMAYLLFYEKQM